MHVTQPTSLAEGRLDVKVQKRFFPGSGAGRCFVEVGAARPDYLSISAYFRELGWKIISVEPNPAFCELHERAGHEILRYACGDRDEDSVDFTVVDSLGNAYRGGEVSFESFSSLGIKDAFEKIRPEHTTTRTIKVNLRKLDSILAVHARDLDRVDILAIDVEGWELEVMAGFDLAKYRAGCVILENYFADRRYSAYMNARGYTRWRVLPPNEVYVSQEFGVRQAEVLLLQGVDRLAAGFAIGGRRLGSAARRVRRLLATSG